MVACVRPSGETISPDCQNLHQHFICFGGFLTGGSPRILGYLPDQMPLAELRGPNVKKQQQQNRDVAHRQSMVRPLPAKNLSWC